MPRIGAAPRVGGVDGRAAVVAANRSLREAKAVRIDA
jgi:hypothetical protein